MNVSAIAGQQLQTASTSGARLFLQYSYLQVLDVLTTLAFLLAGVQEANPLARWLMATTGAPLSGLIAIKSAALLLGLFCWWKGRVRLLRKANVFFSIVIVWNLCCLILGLAARI